MGRSLPGGRKKQSASGAAAVAAATSYASNPTPDTSPRPAPKVTISEPTVTPRPDPIAAQLNQASGGFDFKLPSIAPQKFSSGGGDTVTIEGEQSFSLARLLSNTSSTWLLLPVAVIVILALKRRA